MKTETAWQLITDDCLNALPTIEESSIDACVTDPPYGLEFMGKNWDYGVPGVAYWKEVLRVLKPGAPLLAFGGTRTHHRLMTAIEDAGFELKDCCVWLYGSGFPKSLNISKAIDKAAGVEREVVGIKPGHEEFSNRATTGHITPSDSREGFDRPWMHNKTSQHNYHLQTAPTTAEAKLWDGWGSALKPAYEPIILAMKPLDGTYAHNALTHGVAGLNIDGCRIHSGPSKGGNSTGGSAFGLINDDGWKPKPLLINRSMSQGRWPANVILDEEAGRMLDEQTGTLTSGTGAIIKESAPNRQGNTSTAFGAECRPEGTPIPFYGDSGGASRFFYCAKTSRSERTHKGTIDNPHPTVKPLALMQWLCRLVSTPTGGTILDPFAGSGSTGVAAMKEGLNFVGIEKEEAYAEIARRRLAAAQPVPRHRQASLFDLIGGLD